MELITRGWTIIRRRWPILLACLAIAAVGVAVYNVSSDKLYVASTEVFLRAPDVKSSSAAYEGELFSGRGPKRTRTRFKATSWRRW